MKTGPIPVSISEDSTCPDVCPFKNQGCYAKYGNLTIHWRRVSKHLQGKKWGKFLEDVKTIAAGQLWRHNQAGDLPGKGNRINKYKLFQLAAAALHTRGFTYTHKPLTPANKRAIQTVNENTTFTINLSGNNVAHADELKAQNVGPVTVVMPMDAPAVSYTPAKNKIIICPAQQREGITCSTCQLCYRKNRSVIIGFRAHGTARKIVDSNLKQLKLSL